MRIRARRLEAYLAGLVLRDFMVGVLLAFLALAIGAAGLGNVDLFNHRVSDRVPFNIQRPRSATCDLPPGLSIMSHDIFKPSS